MEDREHILEILQSPNVEWLIFETKEFERPIPNKKIGELMRSIQEADREAGFVIGGIAQHVITFMMEERRTKRKRRTAERMGVAAQRYMEKKPIQ